MRHAALVPFPASVEWLEAEPFDLDGAAIIGEELARDALLASLPRDLSDRVAARAPQPEGPVVTLSIADSAAGKGAAESYRLDVSAAGVHVTGADAAGLFYGVQTLGQLIDRATGTIPAVRIEDSPRYAYRGTMLDVARNFHDVETVLRHIDNIASLKINHLHLHLTDDQGWRIAIDSRPELVEHASATSVSGSGGHFTADDYRRIVAHAAARHVVVVPEVDLPGHTHAVGLAFPDLVAEPVISEEIATTARENDSPLPEPGMPYRGIAVGFSSLRMDDEAVDRFVADVVSDLAALTPGPYVHIGGDEALGTDAAAYARFMARASRTVLTHGKTPIAWHEAGSSSDLADGTIGQYWGFVEPSDGADAKARRFTRGGGSLILSPADAAYLDMKYDDDTPLGLTWAKGPTSVADAYTWDPAEVIDGIDDSEILGIEAPLWTETIADTAAIDEMVFPRLAAVAEIAWSPRTTSERTWSSFRRRVGGLAPLWRDLGIGFHRCAEIDWRDE